MLLKHKKYLNIFIYAPKQIKCKRHWVIFKFCQIEGGNSVLTIMIAIIFKRNHHFLNSKKFMKIFKCYHLNK